MRKVMIALVAGMLLVGVSGAVAQAGDDATSALPTMTIKAHKTTVASGDVVTVDLYIKNVANLATYQFNVASTGGEAGTLAYESIVVDATRKDYVFTGLRSLPAADQKGARAGAVLMGGASRNVTKPEYIGTATFRASPDAKGTFEVSVTKTTKTFLRDSDGRPIVSTVGDPVTVVVTERAPSKRVDKDKR